MTHNHPKTLQWLQSGSCQAMVTIFQQGKYALFSKLKIVKIVDYQYSSKAKTMEMVITMEQTIKNSGPLV